VDGDTKSSLIYFATCDGGSPFDDYSTDITDALKKLEITCPTTVVSGVVSQNCIDACGSLNDAVDALSTAVTDTLDSLLTTKACENYSGIVLGFIEDSFCDSAYSGLFVMVLIYLLVYLHSD